MQFFGGFKTYFPCVPAWMTLKKLDMKDHDEPDSPMVMLPRRLDEKFYTHHIYLAKIYFKFGKR
jgi:hypothetical protein